jgi:O-acetyl-ADP-ribose deacetylase (regulator of RNase III)
MIEFISGNLLKVQSGYIGQGVAEGNQEGLGTGLALEISKKWPHVQSAFKKHCRSTKFKGGSIWTYPPTDNDPGFIYLATQPDMYHATLPYTRKAFKKMDKWAAKHKPEIISLPKIGAGLGKLSWENDIKPLMLELFKKSTTKYFVFENYTHDM